MAPLATEMAPRRPAGESGGGAVVTTGASRPLRPDCGQLAAGQYVRGGTEGSATVTGMEGVVETMTDTIARVKI